MKNIPLWIVFKVISIIFEIIMGVQILVNEFIRHVYIPIVMGGDNQQKIIDDVSKFAKKPTDQVTIVVDVRIGKPSDVARTILKILRYSKIIEESINPKNFNCIVSTYKMSQEEQYQFTSLIQELKPKTSNLNLKYEEQISYMDMIKAQKSKITPLVISFGNYPSIFCLSPHLLIGAEISFNPSILKSCDYDIYTSFEKYSSSQQRKGK